MISSLCSQLTGQAWERCSYNISRKKRKKEVATRCIWTPAINGTWRTGRIFGTGFVSIATTWPGMWTVGDSIADNTKSRFGGRKDSANAAVGGLTRARGESVISIQER
jgi:hypothetical protein